MPDAFAYEIFLNQSAKVTEVSATAREKVFGFDKVR